MKVPVQGDPEHHGDLPRRASSWLELGVGRDGDGRDEERVVLQRRPGEGLGPPFCLGRQVLVVVLLALAAVGALKLDPVFFGVQHRHPASGIRMEQVMVIMAAESQAAKDGGDGELFAIGQV